MVALFTPRCQASGAMKNQKYISNDRGSGRPIEPDDGDRVETEREGYGAPPPLPRISVFEIPSENPAGA